MKTGVEHSHLYETTKDNVRSGDVDFVTSELIFNRPSVCCPFFIHANIHEIGHSAHDDLR